MRGLETTILLGCVAACGGARVPAGATGGGDRAAASSLTVTQAGVGPLDARTRAEVATLRELLPGYRVEPAQEPIEGEDEPLAVIHVRNDAGIVMTVVPGEEGLVDAIWVHDTVTVTADDSAALASGRCEFRELARFPGAWCPDGKLWFVYSPDGSFSFEDGEPVGGEALEMAILEVVLWIASEDAGR